MEEPLHLEHDRKFTEWERSLTAEYFYFGEPNVEILEITIKNEYCDSIYIHLSKEDQDRLVEFIQKSRREVND